MLNTHTKWKRNRNGNGMEKLTLYNEFGTLQNVKAAFRQIPTKRNGMYVYIII